MSTAWFVDAGYLQKTWGRVAGQTKMDYNLLRSKIERDAGEPIGDAYYFNCDNDPPTAGQNAFNNFLRSAPPRGPGLRVKLYWLQTTRHEWPRRMGGGPIMHPTSGEQYITKTQKAVDVGLAFNLMRSFSKRGWKKLYLIAGDGDFHEVIQHLVENEGVEVVVVGTPDSISGELAPFVRIMELSAIRDEITRIDPGASVEEAATDETPAS